MCASWSQHHTPPDVDRRGRIVPLKDEWLGCDPEPFACATVEAGAPSDKTGPSIPALAANVNQPRLTVRTFNNFRDPASRWGGCMNHQHVSL